MFCEIRDLLKIWNGTKLILNDIFFIFKNVNVCVGTTFMILLHGWYGWIDNHSTIYYSQAFHSLKKKGGKFLWNLENNMFIMFDSYTELLYNQNIKKPKRIYFQKIFLQTFLSIQYCKLIFYNSIIWSKKV